MIYSTHTREERLYSLEECDPQWHSVLILPSSIFPLDVYRLAVILRSVLHSERQFQPFVLDTETSLFSAADEVHRGVSAMPSPFSIVAVGGAVNWLSQEHTPQRVIVVDPIADPGRDLAALPSYWDQLLKSRAFSRMRRRLEGDRDEELAKVLRESAAASILELAHMQGIPPALSLSVPHVFYKTANCVPSSRASSCLEIAEPFKRLQPAPSREHFLARLLRDSVATDFPSI